MSAPTYSSFTQWYSEGRLASYVRTMKSPGGILNLLEADQPAGDMSDPAVPDLILYQDMLGGTRVRGDLGGGQFNVMSERGGFFLAAPNFANEVMVETSHQLRSLSFPMAQWQKVLDEAADGRLSFDRPGSTEGRFTRRPSDQRCGTCGLCVKKRVRRRVCWRGLQAARSWPNCAGWAGRRSWLQRAALLRGQSGAVWNCCGRDLPKTSASTNWQPRCGSHHFISHACSSRASAYRHGSI